MIAGLGEVVARGGASGAPAFVTASNTRLDPSLALELQKLLPHRFARELQLIGELCDRGWPLSLECEQDGPAAVGKLVYGDDGLAPDDAWKRNIGVQYSDCQEPACKCFGWMPFTACRLSAADRLHWLASVAAALPRAGRPYRCVAHPTMA